MDVNGMTSWQIIAELPDRFEKRQAFNVANGAADLDQHEINAIIAFEHEFLDRVGHVRDDLNGSAEIVSAPFFRDDILINPTGGDVIAFGRRATCEPLVMTKVEIGFRAIIRDENFAVLIGRHCSRIDVQIRIQFPQTDRISAGLKKGPQSRRRKPFAQGGHHATSDKNIPCHGEFLLKAIA